MALRVSFRTKFGSRTTVRGRRWGLPAYLHVLRHNTVDDPLLGCRPQRVFLLPEVLLRHRIDVRVRTLRRLRGDHAPDLEIAVRVRLVVHRYGDAAVSVQVARFLAAIGGVE